MKGHIGGCESERAVEANPGASCSSPVSANDDVARTLGGREQTPERQRAAMAHRRSPVLENRPAVARAGANGQNGRHASSLRREGQMSQGVDTLVNTVHLAQGHSRLD